MVNGHFKTYAVLKHVFRHKRTKHTFVFRAVAVMVQLGLKHECELCKLV